MRWKSRLSKSGQVLTLLAVAVALLAGAIWWAAPSAVAGGRPRAPEVQSRSLAVPAGLRVAPPSASGAAPASGPDVVSTLDPGMPFTMLGVICDPPSDDGDVLVRLRVSDDGATWSRWYEVSLERVAEAPGEARAYTEAIWTGSARQAQVAAVGVDGDAPVTLTHVRLVALDTQPATSATERAADAVLRQVTGLVRSLNGSSSAYAATAQPQIVTRQEWGADESLRSGEPSFAPVRMAFIHHTAGGNTYTREQAPGVVRGVYEYHTQGLGWSDIGYNFLVDRFGAIYEGRYGGVGQGPIGAQTYGFNTGSTGVSVIGDYMTSAPPAAAQTALEKLLAWKLDLHDIDPRGTATMTCGGTDKYKAGATVKFPAIAGHRDANYTDCPGDAFYAKLPAIRTAVAALSGAAPDLRPLPKWKVAFGIAPAGLAANQRVTLTGKVTTAAGKPGAGSVTLQKRPASGGDWVVWHTLPLAADGSFATTARMTVVQAAQVRARMAADDANAAGYSVTRKVAVAKAVAEQVTLPMPATPAKWKVTLTLAPQQFAVSLRVALTGRVTTASGKAGAGSVTLQKRPASGGEWIDWRVLPLAADGSFADTARMTVAQVSQVRARMATDGANLQGYSITRRVTVTK